jgi:hypothetical protein
MGDACASAGGANAPANAQASNAAKSHLAVFTMFHAPLRFPVNLSR